MQQKGRNTSKTILGKTIVTKSGKTLGRVGDLIFEVRTGELLNLVLVNPTGFATSMDVEVDRAWGHVVYFARVIAVEDVVVISEEDLL